MDGDADDVSLGLPAFGASPSLEEDTTVQRVEASELRTALAVSAAPASPVAVAIRAREGTGEARVSDQTRWQRNARRSSLANQRDTSWVPPSASSPALDRPQRAARRA